MKIMYVSSKKNWGGVSTWMNSTALGLERRGHDVYIMAHPRGRFAASASKKLTIVPRKLGMDYNPFIVQYLKSFIERMNIDVMVTNIEKEVIAGGLAARMCGIPNVRRVGREDDFNRRFKVRWHHRLLVDRCIVPCNLVRDNAVKRADWLDPSQFTTIYNGKNPVSFSTDEIADQRSQWGLSMNDMIIGITSQLTRVKCVDGVIRAFGCLLSVKPGSRLVITGEGAEKQNLELLVKALNISDSVVFAGYSSKPLLAAAAYDIAVSNSRFEGFPNTVVEYLAAGRPVVTTEAGGVAEMVIHRQNGLLIPCDDERLLHDSMLLLTGDKRLREHLAENATETIQAKFSEDIMLDKLEGFFKETIDGFLS